MKEARHKGIHTVCFRVYKLQKQTKPKCSKLPAIKKSWEVITIKGRMGLTSGGGRKVEKDGGGAGGGSSGGDVGFRSGW